MYKDGSKAVKARNTSQILSLVGPILFLPIVLIGFLIDILMHLDLLLLLRALLKHF